MIKKIYRFAQNKNIVSSITVAMLTAVLFFGFFVRDFMMASLYGFGSKLDQFYLVTMLPMFMINIFCIPFGQALIPRLKKMILLGNEKFSAQVGFFSLLAISFCIFLCLLNFFLSNIIISLINNNGWINKDDDIILMQLSILPIIFFSGLIVLCNAILSIKKHYIYQNFVQLVVPIFSILFLTLLGKVISIFAVILGMVFGQFINFLLVYFALKKDNISIFHFNYNLKHLSNFWSGYLHLIVIAIFAASLLLINTFISTTLGEGAAAIYNLGTKFSMFIIGILTAIFSNILLPYLSEISVIQNNYQLRKKIYILVLCSAIVFIPFSLIVFQTSEWLAYLIFSSIVFDNSIILGISSVIKYSSISLPFWAFNAIILKHANAINQFKIVTISSILLLFLNTFFSFNLIKFMNVGGLAFSTSLSTGIASAFMLIYYVKNKHFKLIEGLFLSLTWLFFAIILFALNFESSLRFFNMITLIA